MSFMLDFTFRTMSRMCRASAMAWASMVLPVPGSPLSRSGISSAMEMFTILASSSSSTYLDAPVNCFLPSVSGIGLLLEESKMSSRILFSIMGDLLRREPSIQGASNPV